MRTGIVCMMLVLCLCSCGQQVQTETAAAEQTAVRRVGPADGTKLEMWAFVELHNTFYAGMVEKWNALHPDRQIQMNFTTYPFSDMHNKLLLSLQTGIGAPDLCDIEIGQFPNFLQGIVPLYPLDKALDPYRADLVSARVEAYQKDGVSYGVPTHVGAAVMYYNDELLSSYGIDYREIKTWDDYAEAGRRLRDASGGRVKMTSVDTGGVDWLWVAMAEMGEDWTQGPNIELDSVKQMLAMQQRWLTEGIAMISPDGHVDLEAGYQNILDENIASFPKALWYMSRFLSYMPEMKGKFALAPCPVFKEGEPRSVGIGGTGTVVTNQSKAPELAADFIAWAKCSFEGAAGIWQELGFDPVNTRVWADASITHDASNPYIAFFRTNPFDVLNEIGDEIGKVSVTSISPTLTDWMCVTTLNEVLYAGRDIDRSLREAQAYVELEESLL